MASRFELLVFDWDGTLLDSAGAIVDAIQAACSDLGLPIPADERARHVIGLGLHDVAQPAQLRLARETRHGGRGIGGARERRAVRGRSRALRIRARRSYGASRRAAPVDGRGLLDARRRLAKRASHVSSDVRSVLV